LVYDHLLNILKQKGAGYLILLDPDRLSSEKLIGLAKEAQEAGADAILVGSSLLLNPFLDNLISGIKAVTTLPVILFPGNSHHLSQHADAVFFLSLISGRNPEFLIGEQVKAAPIIKRLGIEPIPIGYMLVESGGFSSVEYMSHTHPIPHQKVDIAMVHALAAEYLGMKMVYLDGGSGAKKPVSEEMIRGVKDYISIPLIVGGGVAGPEEALRRVEAGADFIVIGNALEQRRDNQILREFAQAIHSR